MPRLNCPNPKATQFLKEFVHLTSSLRYLNRIVILKLSLPNDAVPPAGEHPDTDIPFKLPAWQDLPEHLDLAGFDRTRLDQLLHRYQHGTRDIRQRLRSIYGSFDRVPADTKAKVERAYWKAFERGAPPLKARRDKALREESVARMENYRKSLSSRELRGMLRALKEQMETAESHKQGTFSSPMVRQRNEALIDKSRREIAEIEELLERKKKDIRRVMPPDRARRQLKRAEAELKDAEAKRDSDKVAELEDNLERAEWMGRRLDIHPQELRKQLESAKADLQVAEAELDNRKTRARNRILIEKTKEKIAKLEDELQYAEKRQAEATRDAEGEEQTRGDGNSGNPDRAEMSFGPSPLSAQGSLFQKGLPRRLVLL
ncbi:MAG: hypothetical protein M1816_003543 [Peltula sp. TS41687]|nr:MAG: hypothetical protein M1816_003543 [Peltula sp. TS41687]